MRWPISEPTLRSLERTQGARRGFVQQPSHSDVTRVRRPAGVGQALFDGGSSDVATDLDPGDATSPTPRHFQELKSAPPRASGFAYACSATKALAGDGPIAVPHTAAQDDFRNSRTVGPQQAARVAKVVHLSSERTLAPVHQDSSFAEKQESHPALLLVVSMKAGAVSSVRAGRPAAA